MFKSFKIISAVTVVTMLASCTFLDDRGEYSEEIVPTNPPAQAPTFSLEDIQDIPVINDSDFEDDSEFEYDSDFDFDYDFEDEIETEESTEKPAEEEKSEEEKDENSEESEEKAEEKPTEAPKPTETTPQTAPTEPPKPDAEKAKCIDVPFKSQSAYPTGCELVSASMLMEHYGFRIEPMEFIEKGYLKAVPVENKDGKRVGGNPNEVFVGDPKSSSGYGCFSGAMRSCLKKYLGDEMYDVYNLDDMSLSDICSQYIDFGEPVMIWATIDMKPIEKKDDSKWTIEGTNEEFEWLTNEHCMVLVGYDCNFYYFRDPKKDGFTAYNRREAEQRYEEMGKMAMTVIPW